jgi:hypothetical protein
MMLQVSPVFAFRGRTQDGSHPYPLDDMFFAEPHLHNCISLLLFAISSVLSFEFTTVRKTKDNLIYHISSFCMQDDLFCFRSTQQLSLLERLVNLRLQILFRLPQKYISSSTNLRTLVGLIYLIMASSLGPGQDPSSAMARTVSISARSVGLHNG